MNLNLNKSSDISETNKEEIEIDMDKIGKQTTEKNSLLKKLEDLRNQKFNKNISFEEIDDYSNKLKSELQKCKKDNTKIKGFKKSIEKYNKIIEKNKLEIEKLYKNIDEKKNKILDVEEKLTRNKNLYFTDTEKMNKIDLKKVYIKDKDIKNKFLEEEAEKFRKQFNKILDEILKTLLYDMQQFNVKEASTTLLNNIQKIFEILYIDEYKIFQNNLSKLFDIYEQIQNLFSKESLDLLFSDKEKKYNILVISYLNKERNLKSQKIEITDKYNNKICLQTEKSGKIFLNQDYFEEKIKYEFYLR